MSRPDKRAVLAALLEQLNQEISALTEAAMASHEAAIHEEARPEDDKDTRSIEAAYLAGAQADRVMALRETVAAFTWMELPAFGEDDAVALAAMVELEGESGTLTCFIAPQAGGARVTVGGVGVQIVTPKSPLGQSLMGRARGDWLEVPVRGGHREYEVVAVW